MRLRSRRTLRKKRVVAWRLRQCSTPEENLWRHLRTNELGGFHFRRQHVLAGFVVDFYCVAAHLIVELDGDHHRTQVEADRERRAVLEGLGNQVLRFPSAEVRSNLAGVLRRIEAEAMERTLTPCPPAPVGGRGNAS